MATPQMPSTSSLQSEAKIQHWCYKPAKTTHMDYTWIIDNFSAKTAQMQSPSLSTGAEGSKFIIYLNMHDIKRSKNNGYYSIEIELVEAKLYPVLIKSLFSILDNNGEKTKTISYEICTKGRDTLPEQTFITKRNLIADEDELLPDDRLTLFCEMSVTEPGQQVSGQTHRKNISIPESNLSEDLEDLFVNKTHWDVEFIVGPDGQKIQAHKAILTARSSVFRATFENEMKESKDDQVVVSNFSPDVFTEMLRFIYTDHVENVDDMARDLLIIANYYDLERLRIMCEDSLHRNLTIENSAETLLLADLHNSNTLKVYTQNFIKRYAKEFTKTTGFQTMNEKHPKLAVETSTILTNNPMISPVLSEVDSLLLNPKLSDVTLVIGEEILFAHKLMLAAQSPVFAENFEPPNTSNQLIIKDIDSVIMKEVLAYLYTGRLQEGNEIAILLKVLAVAETYEIIKLKTLCTHNLEKKIALDTAIPILIEAADYNATELSKKVLDFIQTNKARILSLDNFEKLCSKKPKLLFKILALDIQK